MQHNTKISGDTAEAILSGRFTFSDNVAFREILNNLAQPNVRTLTIDVGGLDFMDSAGLGMLLVAKDEAGKKSKSLVLRNPQGHIKKLFEASKFYSLFTIV
jgi:anti-anti-sigma factor